MRKFLVFTGSFLFAAALAMGGWWAWPILFPPMPQGWLSTLAKVDADLLQNRVAAARSLLSQTPDRLSVEGWLQWEKRVNAVAAKTGAWEWAAKASAAASSQYPGNAGLAAFRVWTLLKAQQPAAAVSIANKVLRGTPWESLGLQARLEAEGVASGAWEDLRRNLAEPSSASYRLYDHLANVDPDPGLRKNALLSALVAGDLDAARAHLEVLTPAERDKPPFDRLQGLLAYDQGDWARAAALLKSLPRRDQDTLLVLADVYLHLGDAQQARIIYDQMLADRPNDVPLALGINRATLALDENEPTKALELLNRTTAVSGGSGVSQARLLALEARFQLGEKDAVKADLDALLESGAESALALDAYLLKGRLFPEWNSVPRLWSLLHRHPDYSPLAERLVWLLLSAQDYDGAERALDLHESTLQKSGQEAPWWSRELRAMLLAAQDRLPQASEQYQAVPESWRDATYYANWSLVSLTQAKLADPDSRRAFLDTAMEHLGKALDLLPPASDAVSLKRRSAWLTRRGELQMALIPLQSPAQRTALKAAAEEDFRQASQLDPDNLRASFLLRQTLTEQ